MKTCIDIVRGAKVLWGIILFLIVGSVLRMVSLEDMEWKSDERYLYESSQSLKLRGEFPLVGMPSSKGVRNPGLSVWIFLGLGAFSNDPVSMARGVAGLNILALWAFLFFILYCIPEDDREVWLWGLALFAVSANPVLYSRKIWQQCVLVPLLWMFLLGAYFRGLKKGAFLFGMMGALLGQIHMSGFVFVPIVLGAVVCEADRKKTQWIPLLLGLIVGCLPLLPWLMSFEGNNMGGHSLREPLNEILRFKFWWRWLEDGLGLTLRYHLREEFLHEFIKEPLLFGRSTYGVGSCYLLSLLFVSRGAISFIKSKSYLKSHSIRNILFTCLWAFGLGLTVLGLRIYPHYLIIVYPFIHLSVSWVLNERRGLRVGLVTCQALITIWFLIYIHRTGGSPDHEYGLSYSRQLSSEGKF